MRKLIFTSMFFLCVVSTAFSELPFVSEDQFSDWVMHYYQSPAPDQAVDVINFYANSEMFKKQISTRDMVSFFFAYIYKDHPELLKMDLVKIRAFENENARILFLNILWIVDTEESQVIIQQIGKQWSNPFVVEYLTFVKDNLPPQPLVIKPLIPKDLDILWSIFFATGNEQAIKQIISVLVYKNDKDIKKSIMFGAAQWSIIENMQKDPKIRAICQNELMHAKGKIKAALKEILKKHELGKK